MTRAKRLVCGAIVAVSASVALAQQAAPGKNAASSEGLQEVVVTAQKRTELLQDVPVPVTAINAEELVQSNQTSLTEYYNEVPGLSLSPSWDTAAISIRGLSNVAGGPTVAVTLDDMPLGPQGGGSGALEGVDPSGLARIEVLRGPQGTLYGASSLGGLIKYVTADPSSDSVFGYATGGTESIHGGANLGYSFRGAVNVPVSDDAAMRFGAFTHWTPGYIDNVFLGIENQNSSRTNGAQFAFAWHPSDAFSLKLNALYQDVKAKANDESDRTPGMGDFQNTNVAGAGPLDRKVEAVWLVINGKIGSFDLTSVTGFNRTSFNTSFDYSSTLGPIFDFLYGVGGAPAYEEQWDDKYTQELRLTTSIQRFDLLLGGFYTYEKASYENTVNAADPTSGAVAETFLQTVDHQSFSEGAIFANVAWNVSDHFILQAGARKAQIRSERDGAYIGPYTELVLGVPSPAPIQPTHANSSPFTYLFTGQYKFTPDWNVYGRIASGFRPGGGNAVLPPLPTQYQPDKTTNYELGTKGNAFQHKFTWDVSVFYIDWKDTQIALYDIPTNQFYTGNGGTAKSQGVELSLQAKPASGLTVGGWIDYTDAALTQDFPTNNVPGGAYGVAGDPLPYSAKWTGNFTINQEFPLGRGVTGSVGATEIYVGDRKDQFVSQPERTDLPAYWQTNIQAAVKWDLWTLDLFATNVTNTKGLISGGTFHIPPNYFYVIQPRTIGLNITRRF
jgi:outer membrane receptor protein involved in Fe transport